MRPLIIDDHAKAEVARVLAHAEAHPYIPGSMIPGNDDAFVARLGTYRVVFTYTHTENLIWRHLSVSVPSQNYPNPIATFTIAEMFGFTGWDANKPSEPGNTWLMNVNEDEHCVVVAQPLSRDPSKPVN